MVILADSSVWVDFFRVRTVPWVEALQKVSAAGDLHVGDLILTEVLQGARTDIEFEDVKRTLSKFPSVSLCGPRIAARAASNYRTLRQRGITVRGTIDVIIATWCVENDVPIIHNDRDMAVMEQELGLRAYA